MTATVISGTHKAVGIAEKGGSLATFSLPTPAPAEGEVLVTTHYIGFSPLSQWQIDFGLLLSVFPFVVGGSVVGEIVEVGPGVRDELRVGDFVMSYQFERIEQRAHQEYVIVAQHLAAKVPQSLSLPEAATVPASFVTAWHTLATELHLPLPLEFPASVPSQPDLSILVWGGATSSGMYTLQVLKFAGYRNVLTTASPRHFDALRSYGATHVFNYADSDVSAQILRTVKGGKVDIVLDCVGDEEKTVAQVAKVVGPGSRVALLLPIRVGGYGNTTSVAMETSTAFPDGVEVKGVRTQLYQQDPVLKEKLQPFIMRDLLASGEVKAQPFRIVEGGSFLEKTEKALQLFRDGKVRGEKLVVKVLE